MRSERAALYTGLALAVLTLAVFGRSCGNGFVNYDDPSYVTQNPHVLGGLTVDDLGWALTATAASNWHPLTWLSLQTDAQVWGIDPAGYHLTNILLHAANTVLLFWVLLRMTAAVWRSALVAALFGLHPLHVESVAWVAERKDVLSTFFGLLSLWAYARYAERPALGIYTAVTLSFALSLLAKPMLVTLPFVFLLLDYWPLRRWRALAGEGADGVRPVPGCSTARMIAEKLPLLGLSAASCVVTLLAQERGEAMSSLSLLPLDQRLANSIVAYAAYLGKMVWPIGLAAYYLHPRGAVPGWQVATAAALLAGVSVAAFKLRHRCPYLVVGWLWYVGMLVPVVGIVQVGMQAMADRYTYLPLVGVFLMLSWGLADLGNCWRVPVPIGVASGLILLGACAFGSWLQLGYWHDSVRLWEHAVAVTTDNYFAHNNLGEALSQEGEREATRLLQQGEREAARLLQQGKPDESRNARQESSDQARQVRDSSLRQAVAQYEAALAVKHDLAPALYNLGVAQAQLGDLDGAAQRFTAAIAVNPFLPSAHYNLGLVRVQQGSLSEAAEAFSEALRITPDYSNAHTNLGLVLTRQGRLSEAAEQFAAAVQQNPADAEAHAQLALVLALRGDLPRAEAEYRQAVALRPASGRYYCGLGQVLLGEHRDQQAQAAYREGLRLEPGSAENADRLAWQFATCADRRLRSGILAVHFAEQACQATDFRRPEYLDTLAAAYAEAGRFDQAEAAARQALALADRSARPGFEAQVRARLELYRKHQAFGDAGLPAK
jgi:tetratricopeptide (TPR) repeat protein